MSEKPGSQPSESPKNDAKEAIKNLHQQVEAMSTPEQKVESRVGKHLRDILDKGGYLKDEIVDGKPNQVLRARSDEEAQRMVKDIVANFKQSLNQKPELFDGLPGGSSYNFNFEHMLIWGDEGGNLYWDVNVGFDNGKVYVDSPLVLAG